MPVITLKEKKTETKIPENLAEILKSKRHLTEQEIAILKANGNTNSDSLWQNVFVSARDGEFDAGLIRSS